MKLRVCVLAFTLCAVPAAAQTSREERGWVDVNVGIAASGAGEETFTFAYPAFSETLEMASYYAKPSRGADFDFGGGYMFNPKFGLGVSFSGTAHEDSAGLAVSVPHPFFFNASGLDAGVSDVLLRTESAAHIQAMIVPIHSDRFRLRVFGGPSIFRVKADMVGDIDYSQFASIFSRSNSVSILSTTNVETAGTGFGFHGGADASWFFTRVVGIGGFARYSHGNATLSPEPMSLADQDIKVGGFQTGGGLRLRF
jgi:Outer membrane protein beta-barrel domain